VQRNRFHETNRRERIVRKSFGPGGDRTEQDYLSEVSTSLIRQQIGSTSHRVRQGIFDLKQC
jgi:hypothetical protein